MTKPIPYHVGRFPPAAIDWSQLIALIGPANAAIARYDGLLSAIPNARVLLSPLMTQEAVLSSKIEGTQATMGEVLEFEAADDLDDNPAIREIYDETLKTMASITRSRYAVDATEFLFRRPIFKAPDFYKAPNLTPASGRRILNLLQENNFFREIRHSSGRRPAVLAFKRLLNIAEGHDAF